MTPDQKACVRAFLAVYHPLLSDLCVNVKIADALDAEHVFDAVLPDGATTALGKYATFQAGWMAGTDYTARRVEGAFRQFERRTVRR